MTCPKCGRRGPCPCYSGGLPDNLTYIVESRKARKCPDVLVAEEQSVALQARYLAAKTLADSRGAGQRFEEYCATVATSSQPVICMSYAALLSWLPPDRTRGTTLDFRWRYVSRYKRIRAGAHKINLYNTLDRERKRVDAVLSPFYEEEICFAALTLDNRGIHAEYGPAAVILKSASMAECATVFEENQIAFLRNVSRKLPPGDFGLFDEIPPKFLATWRDRALLAAAKAVESGRLFQPDSFADLLLPRNSRGLASDWLEVRHFGSVSWDLIEEIWLQPPPRTDKAQQLECAAILQRLTNLKLTGGYQ